MSQTIDGRTLRRGSVSVDALSDGGESLFDDEIRMYGPADDDLQWASVTTILDSRDDAEDYSGFRSFFDGSGDKPHWQEILNYKGWRGTLAHYKALAPLTQRKLAGDEERDAYEGLKDWEYQHRDALAQAREDVEWVVEQFEAMRDTWDIQPAQMKTVEQYVIDEDLGYAGQLDLAWERVDGASRSSSNSHADSEADDSTTTMIGDIKTSKADDVSDLIKKKFPRYGMQLAAYARAASFEVDEAAIIWISPDTRSTGVILESEWPRPRAEYEDEFTQLAETVQQTLEDYQDSDSNGRR